MSNKEKLVEQYVSNAQLRTDKILQLYPPFFDNPAYDDEVKAEVLLIGDHQARHNDLNSWRDDVQKALDILAKAKLWTRDYSDFKDILNEISRVLPKGTKYIGDLARYDMAIRLASKNLDKLAPREVYLHNGTLAGAMIWVCDENGVPQLKNKNQVVEPSIFDGGLSQLPVYHIEVFLCVMHSRGIKSWKDLQNADLDNQLIFNKEDKRYFRSNLMAHNIFELGMGNLEAKNKSKFWK